MVKFRAFRHHISVLKKQGLVPANIDARSVKPDDKIKGKKASTLVKKYDDVVSNKQSALKVPAKRLREFRAAGYQTTQGRVLIPHSAIEKPVIERGEVVLKSRLAAGMDRVQIPIAFKDIRKQLKYIKDYASTFNKQKHSRQFFGFKFYGNNSSEVSEDITDLINLLETYQSVTEAMKRHESVHKDEGVYRSIEIIRIRNTRNWTFPSEKKSEMTKAYNRERAKRFREKLKRKPEHVQQVYRDMEAEASKRYRAKLRKNKSALKEYKKRAKLRSKKSRIAKKQATKKKLNRRKKK